MIREYDIKAALIDWLYEKGHVDNAVIVNEMVVANWSRRVDIAVANGRLHAYEIKSDADTLKRLPGQVELFSSHFDKLILVVASKFVSTVLSEYPSEVGVLEVVYENKKIHFRQARAGRIVETKDHKILSGFLTKLDMYKFLRMEGVTADISMARADLIELMRSTSVRSLRQYVISTVKEKYSDTFKAFENKRSVEGTYKSISMLSRRELLLRMTLQKTCTVSEVSAKPNPHAKPLNLKGIGKYIDDLDAIPASVIRRYVAD